jgi:hypothetical protein
MHCSVCPALICIHRGHRGHVTPGHCPQQRLTLNTVARETYGGKFRSEVRDCSLPQRHITLEKERAEVGVSRRRYPSSKDGVHTGWGLEGVAVTRGSQAPLNCLEGKRHVGRATGRSVWRLCPGADTQSQGGQKGSVGAFGAAGGWAVAMGA